jgi:hypothetical protein
VRNENPDFDLNRPSFAFASWNQVDFRNLSGDGTNRVKILPDEIRRLDPQNPRRLPGTEGIPKPALRNSK